jgi:hypothetical protein
MQRAIGELDLKALSHLLLWCLAVIPAVLCRKVLRQAIWIEQQLDGWKQAVSGLPEVRVPQFTANILGTAMTVTDMDLRGRETILLFVKPSDGERDIQLRTTVHAFVHKVGGNGVYVVCTGTTEACHTIAGDLTSHHRGEPSPCVLVDADGELADLFRVSRTPIAVGLDGEGRVGKIGEQRTTNKKESG